MNLSASDVLARLDGVRPIAGGWTARCPAHDDRRQSLSVSEARDGKVLLKCHAGCEFADIVRGLGAEAKELFPAGDDVPRRLPPPPKPLPPPLVEAEVQEWQAALRADPDAWRYVTETLRFSPEVVADLGLGLHRTGGRRWLMYPYRRGGRYTYAKGRSIDGKKDFLRTPAGQPSHLFGLDSLEPGGVAIVTEGERDAVAARVLGLHAEVGGDGGAGIVSLPDGANPKLSPAILEPLRSQRRIFVCTDADEAGDLAAAALARALGPDKCCRVRLTTHKDLGDALAALGPDGAVPVLTAFADALPKDRPEGYQGNAHLRLCEMAAGNYEPAPLIATGINALDKALGGGIPQNKLAVIAARTSHGKTATTVRLAVNLATVTGRRVVVLWTEDEEVEFDLRALAVLARTPFPAVLDAYRRKALAPIWARVPPIRKSLWQKNCATVRLDLPTPEEIVALSEREAEVVFLFDHLGEMNWGSGKPKHELIGEGIRVIRSAMLKRKNLLIAMTQLNRDWDRRKAGSDSPEKVRPCLSDIENSGQIEQTARVCIIAEKCFAKQGEEDVPTGEYRYHVFKPRIATAVCAWHEDSATPDNPEPIPMGGPLPRHFAERDDEGEDR